MYQKNNSHRKYLKEVEVPVEFESKDSVIKTQEVTTKKFKVISEPKKTSKPFKAAKYKLKTGMSNFIFCVECGLKLSSNYKYCSACGHENIGLN